MQFKGRSGYLTQRPPRTQRDTFTWATKPAANSYTPWRVVRISDVGESYTTPNKGSEWFTDGTTWRPFTGRQLIYTMGDSVVNKTTNLSTPEILARVKIPAGMLATVDHRLWFEAAYYKSATTDTMSNAYYFGPNNTTADTQIITVAQNSTTRQGQTARMLSRVDSTNLILACGSTSVFGTSTLAPPTNKTVSNLDSVDQWFGAALFLSTGTSETMTLTQFDVWIEG